MSIVIPRSVWKPRYDNGVEVIGTREWLDAGKELWLHHSITNPPGPSATLEQDCEHMRAFEAIGESRFGAGISYTWVVMPSGRVFQGHDIDRQGTHTYQRNNRSRAICLAGNFDVAELPARMQQAVAVLLRELGATLDGGHRDVYATACPGKYAYARIPDINRLATSGEPVDLEDDMYTDNDRKRDEHAAWRLKSFLDVVSPTHSDPNAPNPPEEVQAAIDLNATKWRVHDLLHLNETGSADRVKGEELPFVKAFKSMAETVEKLASDFAELKADLARKADNA